jgi:hypothetical protein
VYVTRTTNLKKRGRASRVTRYRAGANLKTMGLDTLTLDVTNHSLIAAVVEHVSAVTGSSLDIA